MHRIITRQNGATGMGVKPAATHVFSRLILAESAPVLLPSLRAMLVYTNIKGS